MRTCSCRCSTRLPPEIGRVNVTMGYPLRNPGLYLRRTPSWNCSPTAAGKGAGWTFYHADAVGILAHPYVAESDPSRPAPMQEEIVRERRISIDAAWLGRNDLLRLIFSPAERGATGPTGCCGVVAAVARRSLRGRMRVSGWSSWPVISEEISKLRNSLEACDIALTPEVYASLLRATSRRCASPTRASRSKGFRSWASSKPATSTSTT